MFAYSQEEDTPAALMLNQIDEDVKQLSCTNHDGRTNGYYAAIGTASVIGNRYGNIGRRI